MVRTTKVFIGNRKKAKNIALIGKQRRLLQLEKNKLAKVLAKAGVKKEVFNIKAQRLALAKQRRMIQFAKFKRAGGRVKALKLQKRARSFWKALGKI